MIAKAKAEIDRNDVLKLADALGRGEAMPAHQADANARVRQLIQNAKARVDRRDVERLADELGASRSTANP